MRTLSFIPGSALLALCSTTIQAVVHKGFNNPILNGGSMLAYGDWPPALGEPLNIIISNQSDPRVLVETMQEGGLYNYLEGAGFGGECFGLHMGDKQHCDLGDGYKNQTQRCILRYQYFHNEYLGTCLESIYGGNHIRVFKQEDTGAYFLSSSAEMDSQSNHDLGMNAYDSGRGQSTSHTTFTGEITKRGWRYMTQIEYIDDLVPANRTKWNHYTGVQAVGGYISDGLVAVLTVRVVKDSSSFSRDMWSAFGL
ncbi:uncharacterized protein IL334_000339 [Kwoniella shivajii]|uniref:Uncharacterized protein n=1 Tax=Kwoniella shivajii TaxID=564305 RepID=A0ABZ1CPY1_9TREE|nr:hypothetical protein IL334_000339 [Kwoniella shivajii]